MTAGELIKLLEESHPNSPIMVVNDLAPEGYVLSGIEHVSPCEFEDINSTNIYISGKARVL